MAFQVIGYDVEGNEVIGEVMGDDGVYGEDVVGRARAARGQRLMKIPPKPAWRNQLAPGVVQPDEGLVPLALAPQANNGTFNATTSVITFQGQLQKPFRPERLLASTVRTGTSATARLLGVLYVGTDLQQAEITGWDVELIGNPNSFGTRLTCKAAEPGVFVRLVVSLSANLTGTDTIFANLTFLGRVIH